MIAIMNERLVLFMLLLLGRSAVISFGPRASTQTRQHSLASEQQNRRPLSLRQMPDPSSMEKEEKKVTDLLASLEATQEEAEEEGQAAVRTVNERLLAELEEAANQEKSGARSSVGKNLRFDTFRSAKSDEERQAAIEEARDLNGVNPTVTILGSFFAFGIAGGLWLATNFLAEYFAFHPVESDVYFVQRATAVVRNVVIGLVSLASGFFGVTGFGIFLLGIRVAYGVMKGELDPTPMKTPTTSKDDFELPNIWDLMMNKKPGRRRR